MGFHISPFAPIVRTLFKGQTARWLRQRQPIAERAKQAARQQTIFFGQALAQCHRSRFTLGTNQFFRTSFTPSQNKSIEAHAIMMFGSIFQHKHIGVWVAEGPTGSSHATIHVAERPIERKDAPNNLMFNKHVVLELEFTIIQRNNEMYLRHLRSQQPGLGGPTLAALYNMARRLGIQEINYSVMPFAIEAKQFYFHTDFGAPTNEAWDKARVRVA